MRLALSALAGLPLLVAAAQPAQAFEIFGFRLFGSDEADDDIVDPLAYSAALTVAGDEEELQERLEKASLLVAEVEEPVSGSLGLLAKARSDRERLIAALYAEARYDGVVEIAIEGKPLDLLPPDAEFDRAGPVAVTIEVDPGGVFTLGEVRLAGDAAGLAPAQFGLLPGGNAGSNAILKAEADVVRRLKEEGRPLAQVSGREVVADHTTMTVDVTLDVEAGPVAGYGETTVSGTEKVDPGFTSYMTGLPPGRQYSPDEVDAARDRLLGLGVFSSVTIKEGEALDAAGNIPMSVEVSERKMRYYGLGASYSTIDGAGIEGYWGHRNLFGRAESLRVEGSIGGVGETTELTKLNYNAAVLFEKPGVIGPDSKFTANLRTIYDHPDAYDRFTVRGGVGVSYQLSKSQTVSAGLGLDYSKIEDAYGEREYLLASVPLDYVFDNRDNKLDPTRGIRAHAFVEPTYDALGGSTFVKVRGDLSVYAALDQASRFVVAGRMALGTIAGASLADVPADRRFYSGGGGSVRGYAYQGIGPRDPSGKPTGGLSLAETSIELRYKVTDTIGIVPFVDAGTVSHSSFPDFGGVKIGAGIGVRYLTPFGPLRVDAAIPLNRESGDPTFGIYAGVGQAF